MRLRMQQNSCFKLGLSWLGNFCLHTMYRWLWHPCEWMHVQNYLPWSSELLSRYNALLRALPSARRQCSCRWWLPLDSVLVTFRNNMFCVKVMRSIVNGCKYRSVCAISESSFRQFVIHMFPRALPRTANRKMRPYLYCIQSTNHPTVAEILSAEVFLVLN